MSRTNVCLKFILLMVAPAIVAFLAFSGQASSYELVEWEIGPGGYELSLMDAEEDEKPLIIYFHIETGNWNARMRDEYLGEERVEEFLADIPKVEINPDRGPAEKALAARYNVEQYPAFFVFIPSFDAKPERVHPFSKKEMTPREFLDRIKEIIAFQYNEKAVSYFQKKDYEKTIKYFEMSMEYSSKTAYTFYAMGVVYNTMAAETDDLELLKKAEENYKLAIKIDPKHKESIEALNKLGKGSGAGVKTQKKAVP